MMFVLLTVWKKKKKQKTLPGFFDLLERGYHNTEIVS